MKVLLIGGDLCGKVVNVPDGAVSYVTCSVQLLPFSAYLPDECLPPLPPMVVYRIERWIYHQVNRVALIPVGYCWDRPMPEDIEWHKTNNPLSFMELEEGLEWRPYP